MFWIKRFSALTLGYTWILWDDGPHGLSFFFRGLTPPDVSRQERGSCRETTRPWNGSPSQKPKADMTRVRATAALKKYFQVFFKNSVHLTDGIFLESKVFGFSYWLWTRLSHVFSLQGEQCSFLRIKRFRVSRRAWTCPACAYWWQVHQDVKVEFWRVRAVFQRYYSVPIRRISNYIYI